VALRPRLRSPAPPSAPPCAPVSLRPCLCARFVLLGPGQVGAETAAGDNKDVELLTEHEKKRAIIKRSRRNDGQRQQDTLDKLLAFKSASAPLLRGALNPKP
jgi:hypothetical protein